MNTMSIKKDFPVLVNNEGLTYLDSAASSLKPYCVINKIKEYYEEYGVNVHRGVYGLSYKATEEYEATRGIVAKFINALEEEIVFTKGATASLNIIAESYGMANINEGDEIIVNELEHHSSIMPWQEIAKKKKAKLVFIPLNEEGRICLDNFKKVITEKTKIVAINYVSNVMGYVTPLKEIIKIAHDFNAKVIVDAAQAAPHMAIDVKDLDADFLAFSAHKMLGPSGLGVLYGKYELLNKMNPVEFGGDMNDYVEKYDSTFKEAPYKAALQNAAPTPASLKAITLPFAANSSIISIASQHFLMISMGTEQASFKTISMTLAFSAFSSSVSLGMP
jgi:cysteine desulfurase/selenocysteine lyase